MRRTRLHVVNGDSAAGSLRQALGSGGGRVVSHQDVLSVGPLLPFESIDQWRQVRDGFWQDVCAASAAPFHANALLSDLDPIRQADSVVIWMGSGLSDQLLLPSTVRLLELAGGAPSKIATVQFQHVADAAPETVGLGMLGPAELKGHPASEPLSGDGLARLRRVWTALTAPDPGELHLLARGPATGFPLLRRALRILLSRYPDERTGLGSIDREILEGSRDRGPQVGGVMAHTLRRNLELLDPVGDTYVLARIKGLANGRLPHPLLELSGDPYCGREGTERLPGEVRITTAGEDVLAGRKNFVDLNGIDDWVGGVHLESRSGTVWFRRGAELVKAKA